MQTDFEMKSQLDARELMLLDSEVKARGKNMVLAYVLWWFLGWLGGHNFYVGRTGPATGQLILGIASFFLTLLLIGIFGFIALGIWVIVDAFSLHNWINEHNSKLEREIMERILVQRQQQTGA